MTDRPLDELRKMSTPQRVLWVVLLLISLGGMSYGGYLIDQMEKGL